MLYDIDQWMVGWTAPETGEPRSQEVRVGPWPDKTRWSDAYDSTAGCAFSDWHKIETDEEKIDELIRGFFFLVLGERIDPDAVHREFSKIKGYLEYDGRLGVGMGKYTFFQRGRLSPYNGDEVIDPYPPVSP